MPKSTKVNQFVSHRDDGSGAGAVRESTKFTKTTKVNQFLSHNPFLLNCGTRHDGSGDDATPPPTPPSSVDARELPSTSGSGSESQHSDYYSDDGGSKDGI